MLASELETVGKILHELYSSKIGFSISCTVENRSDVKLLDPLHGIVAAESFANGIVAAVEWLVMLPMTITAIPWLRRPSFARRIAKHRYEDSI